MIEFEIAGVVCVCRVSGAAFIHVMVRAGQRVGTAIMWRKVHPP